jgi:serine phosphatase RsbU (regulator of sigma subunit)
VLYAGIVFVASLAVVYPVVADRAQNPLAIFLVPVLLVAALGTARQTMVVGGLATAVALVEGQPDDELGGSALAARLVVIVVASLIGIWVAGERARRQHEIDVANDQALLMDVFQSSLAPVPAPPKRAVVAVRFRFGDERLRLGGDFVDAIELPDGALGYIIGDVCGHGVRAAALGAAIRTGWKTIATHAPDDPVVWVNALDAAFFRLGRREGYVTVNTGRVDLDARRIDYVSAGHPWPILVSESVVRPKPAVSPPIGIRFGSPRRSSVIELAEGATMLLYTDGLYEHPRSTDGTDGESELLSYLTRTDGLDLDAMLEHFGRHGYDDDVALMTIKVATR